MSYLKDREIWLSNVPTGNPPAGFFWKFIQNGKVVVRDSSGNNQMMIATSGSQSITGSLTVTEGITGTVSSASYVEYSGVANKPTLISGSSQVTFLGLSSIPSGIVSGSGQVDQFGYATTGSNGFNGNQSITGSLTVTGQVVAQTLNVQQVTSSVVYSSGSNVFGNELSNTQQFTGSMLVTGSLTVNGTSAVVGFGTANYLSKFTAGSTIGNSQIFDNGTTVFVNATTAPSLGSPEFFVKMGTANTYEGILVASSTNNNVIAIAHTGTQGIITTNFGASGANTPLAFGTNGAGQMTLDTSGRLGIGTTSPDLRLHVDSANGLPASSGSTPVGMFTLRNKSANASHGLFMGVNNASPFGSWVQAQDANSLGTNYPLSLNPNGGNVGIGTASPDDKLHVISTVAAATNNYALRLQNTTTASDSRVGIAFLDNSNTGANGSGATIQTSNNGVDGAGNLLFGTLLNGTNTERMRITSNGNVGIGVNPSYKLHVVGGNEVGSRFIVSGTFAPIQFSGDNSTTLGAINAYNGIIAIGRGTSTGINPDIAINSSNGNVAIGTTTINSERLTVVQTTGNASALYVYTSGVTTGQSYGLTVAAGTNASDRSFAVFNQAGTSEYLKVRGDGYMFSPPTYNNTFGSSANMYVNTDGSFGRATSSLKYKKNIVDYEKGLNDLMKLRPVSYESKNERESGLKFAGLIAEEVYELGLTEFVQYAPDGSPDALSYQNMIALAVKAIQEQQSQIESLKSRIEILEQ